MAFGHRKQMAVPRGEGVSGQSTGSLFTADQRLRSKSGSGKRDTNDRFKAKGAGEVLPFLDYLTSSKATPIFLVRRTPHACILINLY